jgi:hypothetical protein
MVPGPLGGVEQPDGDVVFAVIGAADQNRAPERQLAAGRELERDEFEMLDPVGFGKGAVGQVGQNRPAFGVEIRRKRMPDFLDLA